MSSGSPRITSRAPGLLGWGLQLVPGGPTALICLAIAVWALVAGRIGWAVVLILALVPFALSYGSLPRLVREFDLRDGVVAFTTHTGRAGAMSVADLAALQVLARGEAIVEARLIAETGSIVIDRRHPGLGALLASVFRARPALTVSAPGVVERLRYFWDGADLTLRALGAEQVAASLAGPGIDADRDVVSQGPPNVASAWRLAVPSVLGTLFGAVALIGYLRGDAPLAVALLGAAGLGLILLGYLPLRRLARVLTVSEEAIDATTVLGGRVHLPHARVARVVGTGGPFLLGRQASQLLVTGVGGERLLVVRTRRLADGFDAIVRLHPVEPPTVREAVVGLARRE